MQDRLHIAGLTLLAQRPVGHSVAAIYADRSGRKIARLGCQDVTQLITRFADQPSEMLDWIEQFKYEGLI
ncbi:hypothetical protein D3875_09125 [Deinococcus cavernae]|uniref:Uncharacterized protein n=1 Tax=Deinococcus cavernae TaxID=2320857 RepID=A0A418V6K3_9DEIO|nr:hypothetical protein [Deinococcus cavernae]RJF71706.1 hypothetical protein D3875_09125 [Deinococcus cavernae]